MGHRTRKAGVLMVAGMILLLIALHVALVPFDAAGRNGTLVGVGLGLVNLVVGVALAQRGLRRSTDAALGGLVAGFFVRFGVLVAGTLWFQKIAAVDATAFALSFLVLFFVFLAVEIVLVERALRERTA